MSSQISSQSASPLALIAFSILVLILSHSYRHLWKYNRTNHNDRHKEICESVYIKYIVLSKTHLFHSRTFLSYFTSCRVWKVWSFLCEVLLSLLGLRSVYEWFNRLVKWKWDVIMRIICDVCESAAAILFCAADEAALCRACDDKVWELPVAIRISFSIILGIRVSAFECSFDACFPGYFSLLTDISDASFERKQY